MLATRGRLPASVRICIVGPYHAEWQRLLPKAKLNPIDESGEGGLLRCFYHPAVVAVGGPIGLVAVVGLIAPY